MSGDSPKLEVKQNFVTFFSPGTFFAEQSSEPVDRWDVEKAKELAARVVERYGATPFGFQFTTRGRGKSELDSRVIATSQMYYINCEVRTVEEVEAANNPEEQTLLCNMKANQWRAIVQTASGWKWSQPLRDGDVVLER